MASARHDRRLSLTDLPTKKQMCVYMYMDNYMYMQYHTISGSVCCIHILYIYIFIYIYLFIQRERERVVHRQIGNGGSVYHCTSIYLFTVTQSSDIQQRTSFTSLNPSICKRGDCAHVPHLLTTTGHQVQNRSFCTQLAFLSLATGHGDENHFSQGRSTQWI